MALAAIAGAWSFILLGLGPACSPAHIIRVTSALQVLHPGAYLNNSFQLHSLGRPSPPPLRKPPEQRVCNSFCSVVLSLSLSLSLNFNLHMVSFLFLSFLSCLPFLFAALWPVMSVAQQRASLYQSAVAQTLSALQRPSFISKLFSEEACKLLPHQPPWQKSKLPNAHNNFWRPEEDVDSGLFDFMLAVACIYAQFMLTVNCNDCRTQVRVHQSKSDMFGCPFVFLNTFANGKL